MNTSSAARAEQHRLLADLTEVVTAMETSRLPDTVRTLLETDLTFQQLKVLTVLVTLTEGATVRELADTFAVSMASMSTMLDRLVSQGTARREVDPGDNRVRRIHTTPTGRDVVRRLVGARPEFSDEILATLPLDDLRALAQGLRAVQAAYAARTRSAAG